MSLPWEQHWISTWLARRELARLATDMLVRGLLLVGLAEFGAEALAEWLALGVWPPLVHTLLLTAILPGPLYWLIFRPAARLVARQATASAEAHYQAVVEAVSDAILVTDAAGTILFGNPAVERTFGCDFKELIGHPLPELLPPRTSVRLPALAVGAAAVPAPPEVEGCRRDGSRFPAEVVSRPVQIGGRELRVTVVRDISRRREAERELERLASVPRLNPNPLVECDAEGRITYANPAALRLLQELGGPAPMTRLLPANLAGLVRERLADGNTGGQRETTVGGRTLLWSFHPLPELQRVRVYGVDITGRKQAEEKTAYQARLLASVNDAVIATDERFVITSWNRAAEAIYGWTAEEALGRPLEDVLRTEPWGEPGWVSPSFLEQHGYFSGEVVERRKDGTPLTIEANAFAMKDEEGRLTGYASVNRDVTARKRAAEKLRESEERFRLLVDSLPVAVRVVQAGRLRFTNPAGALLFGYSRPEELQEMSAFEHVAAEDLPRLREYMEKRAAGEAVPVGYEYRARRRDGAEFPAEGMVARITYKGQPASLIVLRDLTERKRLHLFESLLPVCCECGKVRDDTKAPRGRGPWKPLEQYVVEHSDADLTHTFCPDCYRAYRQREGLPPAEPPRE